MLPDDYFVDLQQHVRLFFITTGSLKFNEYSVFSSDDA